MKLFEIFILKLHRIWLLPRSYLICIFSEDEREDDTEKLAAIFVSELVLFCLNEHWTRLMSTLPNLRQKLLSVTHTTRFSNNFVTTNFFSTNL